ncbi:hypothetical protein LZ012_07690 [Dechloromonas sp. XY25]|uniref:Uncharacterized protein n=1 Tax=Dechloromonas hankyongensis TaxID=2908002 RepID=A0ABS9K127_9RHOO|nr:hypothetical protein [Dechloromonas hankyongensis]MCG2576874.1 hypothetical protein [Dechloromonas hankyongensis]
MDLEPGMVLARPVFGRSGQQLSMHLAVGSSITASTISQLITKGVECVAVARQAPADEAGRAEAVARYESRLHEIFGADPDENCGPLLAALLAEGPGTC